VNHSSRMSVCTRPFELDWEAVRGFHGHLGPWLTFGMRAGLLGMERTGARRFFGVRVEVECPDRPPVSCLLDGLQLTTGATYGKRNLVAATSESVRVRVTNTETGDALDLRPRAGLAEEFRARMEAESDEPVSRWVWGLPAGELFVEESAR